MTTFVCGQVCSGKTRFALAYADINNGTFIEVSDIVKQLRQTLTRKELQNTKHLVNKIITNLTSTITSNLQSNWIISGARQVEILQAFPQSVCLWIHAPLEVRKQRYIERSRQGDESSFEEAERGDVDLGILEVKKYILTQL